MSPGGGGATTFRIRLLRELPGVTDRTYPTPQHAMRVVWEEWPNSRVRPLGPGDDPAVVFRASDRRGETVEIVRERGHRPPGAEAGGMTLAGFRSFLYALARLLGDVQAVRRGRIGERLARRAAGRVTGRWLGRLFR